MGETFSNAETNKNPTAVWWGQRGCLAPVEHVSDDFKRRACSNKNQDQFLMTNKMMLKKTWSPLLTHLRSVCTGRSGQNRDPVWRPQQSQQRTSVFLTQHFHCTNTGAHSATQSPTTNKQHDSSTQLWSRKFVLIRFLMPDVSFQKRFPIRAGEETLLLRWTAVFPGPPGTKQTTQRSALLLPHMEPAAIGNKK